MNDTFQDNDTAAYKVTSLTDPVTRTTRVRSQAW